MALLGEAGLSSGGNPKEKETSPADRMESAFLSRIHVRTDP